MDQVSCDLRDCPQGLHFTQRAGKRHVNSLKAKLPYLHDLGITGIWLAGHSWAPPHVYFNVWSQYANLEPDKIEPTLGTPAEFHAALVREAHRQGIKIFLDVHVHGLHPSSPVVAKHPEWFKGDAGGMIDFDWYGNHKDLDQWWIDLWTDCIKQYEVDGFRLDISSREPTFGRKSVRTPPRWGMRLRFTRRGTILSPVSATSRSAALQRPRWPRICPATTRKFGTAGDYHVTIKYADGKSDEGRSNGNGALRVRRDGLSGDKVGRRNGESQPDGVPDLQLTVDKVGKADIKNIVVDDDRGNQWQLGGERRLAVEGKPPKLQIFLATLANGWPTVMLSCHDTGWGASPTLNPYHAQGSRALFGYAVLFTPMIPVFFSGEEFDAHVLADTVAFAQLFGGQQRQPTSANEKDVRRRIAEQSEK